MWRTNTLSGRSFTNPATTTQFFGDSQGNNMAVIFIISTTPITSLMDTTPFESGGNYALLNSYTSANAYFTLWSRGPYAPSQSFLDITATHASGFAIGVGFTYEYAYYTPGPDIEGTGGIGNIGNINFYTLASGQLTNIQSSVQVNNVTDRIQWFFGEWTGPPITAPPYPNNIFGGFATNMQGLAWGGPHSGNATGVTATSLTDSTKAWTVNQWVGYNVGTVGNLNGPAAPQAHIISNTATTLTISGWYGDTPILPGASFYDISPSGTGELGFTGHSGTATQTYNFPPPEVELAARCSDPDLFENPPFHAVGLHTGGFNLQNFAGSGSSGTQAVAFSISVIQPTSSVGLPPVATPKVYTTFVNTKLTVYPTGLLNGTTGGLAPYTFNSNTFPTNGFLSDIGTDGSFTYTPTPGYSGLDLFTYSVRDSNGQTGSSTVVIIIKAGDPVLQVGVTRTQRRQTKS